MNATSSELGSPAPIPRALRWLAFGGVAALLLHRAVGRDLSRWQYANDLWRFTWETGFIRRALPGEVLRLLGFPLDWHLLQGLHLGLAVLLTLALAGLFLRPWRRAPQDLGLLLFGVLVLTHSATLQSRIQDFGRFDILVLLLALVPITAARMPSRAGFALLFLGVSALSVLIHEAAFLMALPVALALRALDDPSRARMGELAFLLGGATLMGFAVLYLGRVGPEQVEALRAAIGRHDEGLRGPIFPLVWEIYVREGVRENMIYAFARGWNLERAFHHLIFLLTLIPLARLLWPLYRDLPFRSSLHRYLTLLLLGLPLSLYLVAHDYFRWWSMALTNAFLFLALASADDTKARKRLCERIRQRPLLLLLCLALNLYFGPLQDMTSYPRVDRWWRGLGLD